MYEELTIVIADYNDHHAWCAIVNPEQCRIHTELMASICDVAETIRVKILTPTPTS
jgi:hypothetical protein